MVHISLDRSWRRLKITVICLPPLPASRSKLDYIFISVVLKILIVVCSYLSRAKVPVVGRQWVKMIVQAIGRQCVTPQNPRSPREIEFMYPYMQLWIGKAIWWLHLSVERKKNRKPLRQNWILRGLYGESAWSGGWETVTCLNRGISLLWKSPRVWVGMFSSTQQVSLVPLSP